MDQGTTNLDEINVAEAAFLKKLDDAFHLRWFKASGEVDLCGIQTTGVTDINGKLQGSKTPNGLLRQEEW